MAAGDEEVWLDDDAGPLIRPYTINEGRTRPTVHLDMLSLVVTTGRPSPEMEPEHVRVLEFCHTPISVTEVAAHIRLPLAVTKILIADLLDRRAMTTRVPYPLPGAEDRALLEALLDGLQRL